MTPKNCGGVAR